MTLQSRAVRARRLALPIALLFGATACGSAGPSTPPPGTPATAAAQTASASASETVAIPTASASPSAMPRTPEPTPTPAPSTSADGAFHLLPAAGPRGYTSEISCSSEIGASDPVAIVQLKGTPDDPGPVVMRDYADPASPRTVCQFGTEPWFIEQLIDARHVVIHPDCDGRHCPLAVVDLPDVVYHWFALPRDADTFPEFIAVSPSLDEIAWSSTVNAVDLNDQNRRLHLTRADGDHIVAHLLPVGGRCGSGDDSNRGAYFATGAYLYVLDVPIAPDTVFVGLHGLDRVFMFRPPDRGWAVKEQPAQPVWSPTDKVLYYRRAGSVWQWTPRGGEQLFLPDTFWQSPTISPDGRYLAYAVPKDDGSTDTYLIDRSSGDGPRLIGEDRGGPVFLTAAQLWWLDTGSGGCVSAEVPRRLIYDIDEAAESNSIIDSVLRVWPATSAQR